MCTDRSATRLLQLLQHGRVDAVHRQLLRQLAAFNRKVYLQPEAYGRDEIDRFLEIFFQVLLRKDFSLEARWKPYLSFVTLVENLSYLSSYGSTTEPLARLMAAGTMDSYKLLLLSNAKIKLDLEQIDRFFLQDKRAASYWLYSLFTRHSFSHPAVAQNLRCLQHRALGYDLQSFGRICALYFNATYVDPENHLLVRSKVNSVIRRHITCAPIFNSCQRNTVPQIAVLSRNWHRSNAVRKCIGAYIRQLGDLGDLVLIAINDTSSTLPKCFSRLYTVQSRKGFVDYNSIAHNNFNIVIFTDVGLNIESLILANMRIAPIQIAMYGHPVSTASPAIDYFIVGEDSETSTIESHYTETTIKLKGPGMNAVRPRVRRPAYEEKIALQSPGTVNIFIAASGPKINPHIVAHWKTIVANAAFPTVLHVLPGEAGMQEVSVLRQHLRDTFGKEVIRFYRRLGYPQYMHIIKGCDLSLGSYPYGDYNRTIDSLWMGTPFIAIQGECGYQNTGAASLRTLGLDHLVARNTGEYVNIALRLINNHDHRAQLQKNILKMPIEPLLVENKAYGSDLNDKLKMLLHHTCPPAHDQIGACHDT